MVWQGPNDLIQQSDSLSLVMREFGIISDLGDMDCGRGKCSSSEIVHLGKGGLEGLECPAVSIVESNADYDCTDMDKWNGDFFQNCRDMGYACPREYINLQVPCVYIIQGS